MEVRQVPKRRASAFVGGYFTTRQRDKIRALATLRGESVSATLRVLIDAATAEAVSVHVPEMQNRAPNRDG